jgi:hypothetical protein
VRFDYTNSGICHMQANAYANGKLVEAELMAQIAKKTVIVK